MHLWTVIQKVGLLLLIYEGFMFSLFANQASDTGAERAKTHLEREFTAIDGSIMAGSDWLKKNFGVDETGVRAVMMSIYRESSAALINERDEFKRSVLEMRIRGVVNHISEVPNDEVKAFLLGIARNNGEDGFLRAMAVRSYLRIAEAEEAREILLWFLVGEERLSGGDRLLIYTYAEGTHDGTDSLEKRAAILGVLAVAADREEEKIIFMKVDGILAKRNGLYRQSRERLAMLERHALEPPTTNLYTDRDLAAALKEVRGYRDLARIDTNLASVAAGEAGWTRLENTVPEKWTPAPPETPKRRLSAWIAGVAAVAAVVAAVGGLLWYIRRLILS